MVIVVLVVTAAGVALIRERHDARADAAQRHVDSVVHELEAFVAHVRGRDFKQPVKVELDDDATFDHQTGGTASMRSFFLALYPTFHALGLPTGPSDPTSIAHELSELEDGIYVVATQVVHVRSTTITPYAKRVLVHELTHALDDQWFNLDSVQLSPDRRVVYLAPSAHRR